MINLKDVCKHYRTEDIETTALNNVTLEIRSGEFVAVMGPSGCGKSTLLNVVGMIDNINQGRYFFDGEEITHYPETSLVELRKQNLGFIFQSFNLIDDLSVYENVELPLLYQNIPKANRQDRVMEVLELVGMTARKQHRPEQLSGGQQQRVAIARAVVGKPKIILADEPTGNLDSKNGDDVIKMLALLNEQGTTILMVTHSQAYAEMGNRVINLLDGAVVNGAAHAN